MRKNLIISFIFVFFALLFTYPAVFHLQDKIIGDGGDNYQFLAFQYIAKLQFEKGQFPFGWTDFWRYPVGFDFGNSYDSTLLMLAGIVGYQFTENPVIVYNLSVLLFLFLDAFFSYLFFEKITNNRVLAVIGALMYGFSFYNIARMGGHPNLILSGVFPFLLYALLTLYQRNADVKSYLLLGLSAVLLFMVSLQYVLIAMGAALFFIPLVFIFYRDITVSFVKLFLFTWKRFFTTTTIVALIFIYFNAAKVQATVTGSLILPGLKILSAPAINFFFPNRYLYTLSESFINTSTKWIDNAVFLGYLEMVLFILYLLSSYGKRRLKGFLFLSVTVFFIVAVGDQGSQVYGLPYTYLFRFLPFRGIIEPARFYTVLNLALVTGVVLYLQKFYKEKSKIGILLVAAFLVFERIPTKFYLSSTQADKPFYPVVAKSDTQGVLDLPLFHEWYNGHLYDLYSVYYKKPIVNGYIHWSGNTSDAMYFITKHKRFECAPHIWLESNETLSEEQRQEEIDKNQELLREMHGYGIRTVVFHKTFPGVVYCPRVQQRIEILLMHSGVQFNKLYEDKDTSVYHLPDQL